MADETYASTKKFLKRGGPYEEERGVVYTSETIKPGFVIYKDANNRLYSAITGDTKWSGVAGLKGGHDIDTAYTATAGNEEKIPYFKKNGCRLNLILEATSPAVAIIEGDPIIIGAEDGKVRRFAYAGDAGDTQDLIGHADECLTPDVLYDKIIGVRLVGGN